MGWSRAEVRAFADLGPKLPHPVRMIELGAQVIFAADEDIKHMMRTLGGSPADEPLERINGGVPAWKIATHLGWAYACIDLSHEHNAIPLDLNFDVVPKEHVGAHNVVTNFGTTEHLINQFNAHKIAHDLVAPGGLIMHHLPAGGYFTHGFFSYTPGFFKALAIANRYETLMLRWKVVPSDKKTVLQNFGPDNGMLDEATAADFGYTDAALQVIYRKVSTAPFVPPFDGVVGEISDEAFRRRYLLDPNAYRPVAIS